MKHTYKQSTFGLLALLVLAAMSACSVDDYERPVTVEYINETILKPSCGTVNCHSALGKTKGYIFGEIEQTKETLRILVTPGDAQQSALIAVMRRQFEPMPPIDAVNDVDLELIESWINNGAKGLK
jgi:hypothetical protein